MHIAFLTARYPPDVIGGGEVSTRLLAEALAESGHTVTVLCGSLEERDEMAGGVRILRARSLHAWWAKPLNETLVSRQTARAVSRILRILPAPPVIVHAQEFRSALALAFLEHPHRVVTVRDYAPICGTTSNLWFTGEACDGCSWMNVLTRCHRVAEASLPRKPFLVWQYKTNLPARWAAYRAIPQHIYTSEVLRDRVLTRLLPAPSIQTIVLPNPVDPTWLQHPTVEPPNEPILYGFGRLEFSKGTDTLLQACTILVSSFPGLRLHLGGGEVSRYRALAAGLRISRHIVFHGSLTNAGVRDVIDQAAVVVAPHRWEEPFGRAALEAGARARPLVTSDRGGVRETTTAETAVRVPPGDPGALATAIAALFRDRARARQIGHAARAHVEHHYAPRSIAQQHVDLYTRLTGSGALA